MTPVPVFSRLIVAGAALLFASAPMAQTVKIGVISTYSGFLARSGEQMEHGFRLYMKLHEKDLPPGVKVELVVRDDGGPMPDKGKQLAQELIVRDKIQILTGMMWSPVALAIAPLVTEAKVPMVIMNAAASVITTRSPYIVRLSFTEWQHAYPLGLWAAKKYKRAYTLVSDLAPGHDAEEAFARGFTQGGGQVLAKVRMPIQNIDYTPYMQRAGDAKPDVLFAFVNSGVTATQLIKIYSNLGLAKAGIKLIGSGNITSDEELPNMGDAALGVITAYHYSVAADRPANKAFLAALRKEYGEKEVPSVFTLGGWDGMAAIFEAIRQQGGRIDPDKTIEILRNYKNPNSPRGLISIDPETRDVVHNEYIREVRKVGGQLANVEIETIPNVKDPWKELNQKK